MVKIAGDVTVVLLHMTVPVMSLLDNVTAPTTTRTDNVLSVLMVTMVTTVTPASVSDQIQYVIKIVVSVTVPPSLSTWIPEPVRGVQTSTGW